MQAPRVLQVLHLLLPINVLPVNMLICQRKRRRKGVQRQERLIIARNFCYKLILLWQRVPAWAIQHHPQLLYLQPIIPAMGI